MLGLDLLGDHVLQPLQVTKETECLVGGARGRTALESQRSFPFLLYNQTDFLFPFLG